MGRARVFGTVSIILQFDNRQIASGTRFREIFTAPTRVRIMDTRSGSFIPDRLPILGKIHFLSIGITDILDFYSVQRRSYFRKYIQCDQVIMA